LTPPDEADHPDPLLNEEETLPVTLRDLPREVAGSTSSSG
jgi:hypothetical protein